MTESAQDPFAPYQTDALILLVGTNPLPNYVAALLLARPGATLCLLHSTGTRGTTPVADRLAERLRGRRPDLQMARHDVDEVDGQKIEQKVGQIVGRLDPATTTVGLNYSGGTKPMAVHAYQAVRQRFPAASFSYLDARGLKLVVTRAGDPTQRLAVGRAVEVSLEELLALHGYELPQGRRDTPRLPELSRVIAKIHSTPGGFAQWRDWTRSLEKRPALPPGDQYPALVPAVEAVGALCREGVAPETGLAQALGFARFESCAKFLIGDWLEEHTLAEFQAIAGRLEIRHLGIDLHPKRVDGSTERDWNLDVAAMYGYQLFAISCIATEEPGKAKEHLFEVYVRARQVGGDEARLALISCVKVPCTLQREIEQRWDAEGRIQVLGQADLPVLADRLRQWFEKASKEAP